MKTPFPTLLKVCTGPVILCPVYTMLYRTRSKPCAWVSKAMRTPRRRAVAQQILECQRSLRGQFSGQHSSNQYLFATSNISHRSKNAKARSDLQDTKELRSNKMATKIACTRAPSRHTTHERHLSQIKKVLSPQASVICRCMYWYWISSFLDRS